MSFNSRFKKNQAARAASAITAVAAGSTVAGNAIQLSKVRPGTCIAAEFSMLVNTSSLTMAPGFEGSVDGGTTWQKLYTMNSAANVATAAGTGSDVTTARTILTPAAPLPFTHLRPIVVTGGATAHATADTLAVKMHYIEAEYT